ncbi:MAG: hypothetical protein IPO90_01505 [Flavobacteriales bacterium]|nr:hypothetical protein [Flavobacteriales bacterium]
MVTKFLKEATLLSLPILAGTALYSFSHRDTFPAPRITDNISINEKLRFYKNTGPEPLDVLAVGSSMTLNNLSSTAVMEHFGNVRYMNFGAWGLGLGNTRQLVLALQKRSGCNTVIICTNLMEFSTEIPTLPMDSSAIMRYLWQDNALVPYLREHEATYYLRNMETNVIRLNDPTNYEYLKFDEHGGATLDVPPGLRAQDRWIKPPPPLDAMVDSTYAQVAGIGKELAAQKVHLIWVHSPFRQGALTPEVRERVRVHLDRLRQILVPIGHVVLDAENQTWPDDLYSDYSHFNSAGAYRFTTECLSQLSADLP